MFVTVELCDSQIKEAIEEYLRKELGHVKVGYMSISQTDDRNCTIHSAIVKVELPRRQE